MRDELLLYDNEDKMNMVMKLKKRSLICFKDLKNLISVLKIVWRGQKRIYIKPDWI